MENAAYRKGLPPALVAAIVAAIVLSVVSPIFAVPIAPVLVIAGAVSLRRSSEPLTRGLAWGAVIIGVVLLLMAAIVLLGLFAAGATMTMSEGVVETVPTP